MSFKAARQELLYAVAEDVISEEEFFLLYDINQSRNLDLPCNLYAPFNYEDMAADECVAEFRVAKPDLPILARALRIPDYFTCGQGSVVGGMEGLCMLLRRLAYPCRYSDMMQRFGSRQVCIYARSF